MLTHDFSLRIKALDQTSGAFSGFASTYDNTDDVGDRILAGAFTRTIAQQKTFPLLWAHSANEPIGTAHVEDSRDGLMTHGQLVLEDPHT
jgi:Escherichia/Staphylococcus phage prohead protease